MIDSFWVENPLYRSNHPIVLHNRRSNHTLYHEETLGDRFLWLDRIRGGRRILRSRLGGPWCRQQHAGRVFWPSGRHPVSRRDSIGTEVSAGHFFSIRGLNGERSESSPTSSGHRHSCGRRSTKPHWADRLVPAQTADSDRYRFRSRQTIPHFVACYGIEASNRGSPAHKPGRKIPILRQIRLAHDWL